MFDDDPAENAEQDDAPFGTSRDPIDPYDVSLADEAGGWLVEHLADHNVERAAPQCTSLRRRAGNRSSA